MPFRLKPTYVVERVTDINLDDLQKDGVKGLIFDLDNTIMAPKTGELTPDIADWLELVKNDFKIAIVSNNPREHYIQKAAEIVSCRAYGKAKKPSKNVTSKALKEMELLPSQVAIVGDRPLTDIWVGQKLGLTTILVDPLIKREEAAIIKFLRKIERLFAHPPKKIFSDKSNQD